jgi:hypothetical protein
MSRNIIKPEDGKKSKRIAKGVFAAGFAFFFIKGLLWLAIGGLALIGVFR